MARVAVFDELNNLEKKTERSVLPINQFFQEMNLPLDRIEDRIALAYKLQPIFTYLFFMASTMISAGGEIDFVYLYEIAQRRYMDAVIEFKEALGNDPKVMERIVSISQDIVNTTIDNIRDEYYTSDDRATFIAETETNVICNYDDLQEAMNEGFTMKRWLTMRDNKVRRDHADVEGVEIPINEFFNVGGSEMMYPCDMDAEPEQIVNCRCSVEFF